MSPIEMFRAFGLRDPKQKVSIPRDDPIGDIIKGGGHPSPSEIREYRGPHTVRPFIIADAVFYKSKGRRTNDFEIVHPANSQIRPYVWDLGHYKSNPELVDFCFEDVGFIRALYSHDMAERSRLGENYAAIRFIADARVNGQEYEWSAEALTNHRATLQDILEKSKIAKASDLSSRLKSVRANLGNVGHQIKAYDDLGASIEAYQRDISTLNLFKWSEEDRKEANEILREVLESLNELKVRPIPQEDVSAKSSRYFDDFQYYGEKPNVLKSADSCIRGVNEPVLVHNLDHLQYSGSLDGKFDPSWRYKEGQEGRSYLEDLLITSIRKAKNGNPMYYVPVLVKLAEDVDKLRKEAELNAHRWDKSYSKSIAVSQMGGIFLEHLRNNAQDAEIVQLVQLFLQYQRSELMRRVIRDYAQITIQSDTDFAKYRSWLINHFRIIRDEVGKDGEEFLMLQLERERRYHDPKTVEDLMRSHEKLDKITNSQKRWGFSIF